MPSSLLSPRVSSPPWGWRQLCLKCHGPSDSQLATSLLHPMSTITAFQKRCFLGGVEAPILVPGPGGIQSLSQVCKEGPLLKDLSFEAFTWHVSTLHAGAPGRNISPPFPSLGQLKGEIRPGKHALPSAALKGAFMLQLTECFSGLWSPSKAPNPCAASHGHHENPALALHLVLNEDLAPNFVFLD